jgi:hypothetical protein
VPTVSIKKNLPKAYQVSSSNRSKSFLLPYFVFFFAGLLTICSVSAQFMIDSSYIKKFRKENDVEVYTGATKTSFRFRHFFNDDYISQYKLFANTSAFTGFTIDYNWLSLDFSKNIP